MNQLNIFALQSANFRPKFNSSPLKNDAWKMTFLLLHSGKLT